MAEPTMTDVTRQRNGATGGDRDGSFTTFIRKFARALTDGDARTISTMWAVPALVLTDRGTRAVSSRDEVEAFFPGVREQYVSRGINEARPEIQSLDWVTDQIVIARVRWPYVDMKAQEIGEESSTYTLRRDDGGDLKIVAIVMHGDKS